MCNLNTIEYFAKNPTNTYIVHALDAYISLRGDGGLNSARTHLERVLSLHGSVD